jgi:hypothetical protein
LSLSYWIDNLGFITEGKLAAIFIKTFSWGFPTGRSFLLHQLGPISEKTLRTRSIFQKTYYKPSPSSTRDREGPEALPGSLTEREITTGGLLHHHACLRSDV